MKVRVSKKTEDNRAKRDNVDRFISKCKKKRLVVG